MSGAPIRELSDGLQTFRDQLHGDSLATKRVELSVVTFGPVRADSGFVSAEYFAPPTLTAQGDTPMGKAIETALAQLKARKAEYRTNGISYFRPWVFLITDGAPTDSWNQAAALVREGEASKAFSFFAVGVSGANMEILRQISVREPLSLQGLQFRELFAWLSASLRAVSQSALGTEVPLQSPAGWASV